MIPSPNPYRTGLHTLSPAGDASLSPMARALVQAVRDAPALADFTAVAKVHRVSIAITDTSHAETESTVEARMRAGLAEAEREIVRMRHVLDAYGGHAFQPTPFHIPAKWIDAPTAPEIMENLWRELRRHNAVLIKAGARDVILDRSGAYRLAQPTVQVPA